MINLPSRVTPQNPAIGWFSGGVTSAVTCHLVVEMFGKENVRIIFIDTKNEDPDTYRFMADCQKWYGVEIERIIFIDTKNEDPDTYRFMADCQKWYGVEIERISNPKYKTIQQVWRRFNSLNVNFDAICSSELKRETREKWQKDNQYSCQAFGFDIDEPNRAKGMAMNYPKSKPIFPLLMFGMSKKQTIGIIEAAGIEIPQAYHYGFHNNNCLNTGCVQGGIGYWQKMLKTFPKKFEAMAAIEHELTDAKGQPVTMLKDQSKGGGLLFLMPHPDYPDVKDISMKKGREVKPLVECNGFCGTNDLEPRSDTEKEINYQTDIFQQGA